MKKVSAMKTIVCPICDDPCGKEYTDTWNDPGFREGKGENFTDINGVWYCSQECLTTYEDAIEAITREVGSYRDVFDADGDQ